MAAYVEGHRRRFCLLVFIPIHPPNLFLWHQLLQDFTVDLRSTAPWDYFSARLGMLIHPDFQSKQLPDSWPIW